MQTQTVTITELKKENGVPIYQTNINPITFKAPQKKVVKEDIKEVAGAFVLHNGKIKIPCLIIFLFIVFFSFIR